MEKIEYMYKGVNYQKVYANTYSRNRFYLHTFLKLFFCWLPVCFRLNITHAPGEIKVRYKYTSFSYILLMYKQQKYVEFYGQDKYMMSTGTSILDWKV